MTLLTLCMFCYTRNEALLICYSSGPGFNNVGGAYVAVHITDECKLMLLVA